MKLKVISQIVFLFVLPVSLLYFEVVPFRYRYIVLGIVLICILSIIHKERWSAKELGIRKDNLLRSALPYALLTMLGIGVVIVSAGIMGKNPDITNLWNPYPLYLLSFIPACFVQEFAFRSFLLPQLKSAIKSLPTAIVVNAVLFSLIHLIYPELYALLPITFLGGIGFAIWYHRYPNLWLLTLSHVVLNFLMMLYGFFSIRQ